MARRGSRRSAARSAGRHRRGSRPAAGGGIGGACAAALAAEGWRVHAADLDAGRIAHGEAHALDATDPDAVMAFAEACGPVGAMIYAAGAVATQPVADAGPRDVAARAGGQPRRRRLGRAGLRAHLVRGRRDGVRLLRGRPARGGPSRRLLRVQVRPARARGGGRGGARAAPDPRQRGRAGQRGHAHASGGGPRRGLRHRAGRGRGVGGLRARRRRPPPDRARGGGRDLRGLCGPAFPATTGAVVRADAGYLLA